MPNAPQSPDLESWRAFIDAHELGIVGNRVSKDREQLLKEKLEKENKLLDLKIAREEGTSIDRTAVDALLLHVATMQKTVLYPALERELPAKAEGRTAAEISLIGREIGDRLCAVFSSQIETWQRQI